MADQDHIEIRPGVFEAADRLTAEERASATELQKAKRQMYEEILEMVDAVLVATGRSATDPIPLPADIMIPHNESTYFKLQHAVGAMGSWLDDLGVPRPRR